MVKNITAISASGGNPHKDMSVSFSWHVHSSSYLGSICQAFVTIFLETSKCLAIAGGGGGGRKCIWGKKGNQVRQGKCIYFGVRRGKCVWEKKREVCVGVLMR